MIQFFSDFAWKKRKLNSFNILNEKPYYTGQGFFFIYLEHIFFAQKYLHVPFMAVPTIEADQAVASSYFLKKVN